ncbi:MAG TPA: hypothetical protein PLT28_00480 [Saprospiraceae bacterium]|nr:hypothetical protein [Saprospiraceae bacterium]
MLAIFCLVRAILYPGTLICVASKQRKQALEVLDKIKAMMFVSPNIGLEIDLTDMSWAVNDAHIGFRNGSRITVVTASDSARGYRAHVVIIDEYVRVDRDVINSVLKHLNAEPRHPKFLDKPEYENRLELREENKELYASSCWFQSDWSFEKAKTFCANMLKINKAYFMCGLPYQLSVAEGLLLKSSIEDDMGESDFNAVSFQMEMEALWFGEAESGLYHYDDLIRARTVQYPMYPLSIASKISDKRLRIAPKQPGEKRILSMDIALMASSKKQNNDATSFFITQLLPISSNKYMKNVIYTENVEGMHAEDQVLMGRQLFDEYNCDYYVIDATGLGKPMVDLLLRDRQDPTTGIIYRALSCCNNDEIAARCSDSTAPKVIWAIQGGAQLNSDCAMKLRESFRDGTLHLLVNEFEAEDKYLSTLNGYNKLSLVDKVQLKMPYVHTELLINELVNLECTYVNNVVKVKEKTGMRKDRYCSLAYNNYVALALEQELSSSHKNTQDEIMLLIKAPKVC